MKFLRIARLIARVLLLLMGSGAAVVGVAQLAPRGCTVRAHERPDTERAARPADKPAAQTQRQKPAALRGGLHLVARSHKRKQPTTKTNL